MNKIFYALHNVLVIYLVVLVVGLSGLCFAEGKLISATEIDEADQEVSVDNRIDNIYIKPATDQVTVTTIDQFKNVQGEIVRSKAGAVENLIDIGEITDCSDLQPELDSLIDKIAAQILIKRAREE